MGLLKAPQLLLKALKGLLKALEGLLKHLRGCLRHFRGCLEGWNALIERCAAAMEVAQKRIPFRYNNCIKISLNCTRHLVATPRMKHINVVLYWQSADFVWLNIAVRILQDSVKGVINTCYEWRGEVQSRFWWGNLRERDHLGDPGVDGRIILRWIFRKWDGAELD
jgi:hypothetical protein